MYEINELCFDPWILLGKNMSTMIATLVGFRPANYAKRMSVFKQDSENQQRMGRLRASCKETFFVENSHRIDEEDGDINDLSEHFDR